MPGGTGAVDPRSELDRREVRELYDSALVYAERARSVVVEGLQSGFKIETKADQSFVTSVDRAVELELRAGIETSYPRHSIIAEEFPNRLCNSDFTWILDPIDGTLSFKNGIPLYGVIISLYYKDLPVLGVIDLPGIQRRYSAAFQLGAFRNDCPLPRLSGGGADPGEVIAAGDLQTFRAVGRWDHFQRLLDQQPHVRTYADCFGHTLAFEGSAAAMIDFHIRRWDFAASRIIVEELGGRFLALQHSTDSDGEIRYNCLLGRPAVVDSLARFFELEPVNH